MDETKSNENQSLPRKPRPWLFGIAVAFVIIVAVIGAHLFVQQQGNTGLGSDKQEETGAKTQSKTGTARITVHAEGLDEQGSRVALTIEGTQADGYEFSEQKYVSAGDNTIDLPTGSYHVSCKGSPIAADGTVYTVPEAQQSLKVEPSDGTDKDTGSVVAFEFRAIPKTEVTDEQIAEAKAIVEGDDQRAGSATTLAEAAKTRRDKAIAADDEQNTIQLSGFEIVIPRAWREDADVAQGQDSVVVTCREGAHEWTLITANKDIAKSPVFDERGTFTTLENGNQFCVFPWEDTTVIACVKSSDGRGIGLTTSVFSEDCERTRANLSGGQPGNWRTPLALQATVAGMSTSEDPTKIAESCLRAIAETVTFTEDDSDYTMEFPGGSFVLPQAWRGTVDVDEGRYLITLEGRRILAFGTNAKSVDEQASHIGIRHTEQLNNGSRLDLVNAEDGYFYWKITTPSGSVACGMVSNGTWEATAYGNSQAQAAIMQDYRALQVATTGLSADVDASELTFACMRVCAENMTIG